MTDEFCISGDIPQILSMVSIRDNAPAAVIVLNIIIGTVACLTGDVLSILEFVGFIIWVVHCTVFLALIRLRLTGYQGPSNSAVFRVPLPLPFIMVTICLYIIVVPVVAAPRLHYLYAVICILIGLPFYFIFKYFKAFNKLRDNMTVRFQLLFRTAVPDKDIL